MGEIKTDYKVKYICGILFNPYWFKENFTQSDLLDIAKRINSVVEKEFSQKLSLEIKVDLQSEIIRFACTDYYNEEMGENLFRYWISFTPVVLAKELYKIKILTNEIEKKFFSDDDKNRKVNLDPGYIDGSKLVLFSTKNYSHRIYLDCGIFAEVTLLYKHKQFHTLDWTYPDYKTQTAIEFFSKVREVYLTSYVAV